MSRKANSARDMEQTSGRGMVLPFQPLALTFAHVNYYVPMPKASPPRLHCTRCGSVAGMLCSCCCAVHAAMGWGGLMVLPSQPPALTFAHIKKLSAHARGAPLSTA